jgi:hypothetical protein
MFEKERFIEDCRAALGERTPQAIRELVERAVREPADMKHTMQEFEKANQRLRAGSSGA